MFIADKEILFIHVPKVAGQSMENALLASLGKNRTAHGAQYLLRKNTDPKLGPPRLAHLTASDYVAYGHLDQEDFRRSFKFGFVRNPWSRAVSFYHYSGLSAIVDFETFVMVYLERLMNDSYWFYRPQTEFLYNAKGKLLVDFVGRFESLQTDWAYCASHFGIAADLPKDNSTKPARFISLKTLRWIRTYPDLLFKLGQKQTKADHYSGYYTPESRERIAMLYASDIEHFQYEFDIL